MGIEALLKNREINVVLSDFNIARFEGLQVLEAVRAHDPRVPVIIVTGTGSEEIAMMALKQSAADYMIKRPKLRGKAISPLLHLSSRRRCYWTSENLLG